MLKPSRRLEKVDTLVVDKTGTLTEGKPKLAAVSALQSGQENEVLRLAASLERASEHPLGAAIVNGAKDRLLHLADPSNFFYIAGKGIRGTVEGKQVAVGNSALMSEVGAPSPGQNAEPQRVCPGQQFSLVAIDGKSLAVSRRC